MNVRLLKKEALEIFKAALNAADGYKAVKNYLARRSLPHVRGDIFLIGAGKASCRMAAAAEEFLGDKLTSGVVVTKYGHGFPLKKVKVVEAGHPLPDANGLNASLQISNLLKGTKEEDLVLVLISGGGSALLPFPVDGINLTDKIKITKILLKAGAGIHELNTVRKHLSKIKGGGLARIAYPASVISLLISDVLGDDLSVISSGLTAPDTSTYKEALGIIKRFGLEGKTPVSIINHLRKGASGKIEETPKPKDKIFRRVNNVIIASNRLALKSAEREAKRRGYRTEILTSSLTGEAFQAGKFCAALTREIAGRKDVRRTPTALILGGETTVTVRGNGKGGRNQELALSAAVEIAGLKNAVILSAGTDGSDGPTDAAGAIVDGASIESGRKSGMDAKDYLLRNDSYHYFKTAGGHINTGPTGTNVMDIILILVNTK